MELNIDQASGSDSTIIFASVDLKHGKECPCWECRERGYLSRIKALEAALERVKFNAVMALAPNFGREK